MDEQDEIQVPADVQAVDESPEVIEANDYITLGLEEYKTPFKQQEGLSRAWCFTLNNYTDADVKRIKAYAKDKTVYMIFGKEVGKKGTPHLQGFVYHKEKKSLKQMKKALHNGAHLEITRGSALSNTRYCNKEDQYPFIFGKPPSDAQEKGRLSKEKYEKIWASALQGDITKISAQQRIQYYRILKQIAVDNVPRMWEPLESCCGLWLYGGFGCGKSTAARKMFPHAYIKTPDQWWDCYQGQEAVILEDFDPYMKGLSRSIKEWADRVVFPAAYKGGIYPGIRPKYFVVTSQYHPQQIWDNDEESFGAIQDRFVVTEMQGKSRRKAVKRTNPFAKLGVEQKDRKFQRVHKVAYGHDCADH